MQKKKKTISLDIALEHLNKSLDKRSRDSERRNSNIKKKQERKIKEEEEKVLNESLPSFRFLDIEKD